MTSRQSWKIKIPALKTRDKDGAPSTLHVLICPVPTNQLEKFRFDPNRVELAELLSHFRIIITYAKFYVSVSSKPANRKLPIEAETKQFCRPHLSSFWTL